MAMPFYEGVTLKETLRALDGPPDEGWLKSLLVQLLDALEIIHNRQCYHRDIAPDNILILPGDIPLLLDFGAARRVIGDMTQALTVILKPGYAPIEQYAEVPNMKQGPWTDLYALSSVVYFAITGKAPVPAVARVMSDPLVPLGQAAAGQYSEEFLRAIDAGLAVRPEERPQDIAQFREALGFAARDPATRLFASSPDALRTALPPTAIAATARAKTGPQRSTAAAAPANRGRLVLIAGAAAAALLLIGLVLFIVFDDPPAGATPARDSSAQATADAPAGEGTPDLAAKLAAFDCARLDASVSGGTATVRGHVGSDADLERLRSELASVQGISKVDHGAVRVFPRPYCTVVSALAPYARDAQGPTIALKGGAKAAMEGDKLVAEITGAAFDGYVYADLYEPEGNVVHLLPNAKEKKNQLTAGQRVAIGDDPLFGRQWDVVPPLGKHLLVVMASRKPVFERQRPEVEDIFGYLRSVRDAVGSRSADEFAAHYTLIEFNPKK
jgi:hypothetical protein